jgi:hypothetical protein
MRIYAGREIAEGLITFWPPYILTLSLKCKIKSNQGVMNMRNKKRQSSPNYPAQVSRERDRRQTKSARNAVYECPLDILIGKFVSASRRPNLLWFESPKASISPSESPFLSRASRSWNLIRPNGIIDASCARDFPRRAFTKHSKTVFQRANSTTTSGRIRLRRITISIARDLLYQWILLVRVKSRVVNPSTLTDILLWWCSDKRSFDQWIRWLKSSWLSFGLWWWFRQQTFGMDWSIQRKSEPVTWTHIRHSCTAKYPCSISRGWVNLSFYVTETISPR